MSAPEIISLIVNLLFGTGFIVTLVTLSQIRKKAKAEADGATTEVQKSNVDLVSSSVNEMLQSVNALMTQNKELVSELVTKNKEKDDLSKRVDQLEKKVACMVRTNREVIKLLEKLGVDEHIINMLKEETR